MSSLAERPLGPAPVATGDRGKKRSIKLLSCIIRSEKLEAITDRLNKLNLVGGMTISDVRGAGHEKGEPQFYHGQRYVAPYVPRIRIEIVIEADDVKTVEELIGELARTGEVGDGKVFVMNVADTMRIRTGERGTSAL